MPKVATKPAAALTLTLPPLKKGEHYAGIMLSAGKPTHHLILLPGDIEADWKKAGAWAKKQGGELPTRKEQALLFANAADQFEQRYYWSGEQHASDPSYAWLQDFGYGDQSSSRMANAYRARAVRRIAI